MSYQKPDGTRFDLDSEEVIAAGGNAVILHSGDNALKIPLRRSIEGLDEKKARKINFWNDAARAILENEKAVYQRVQHLNGIAQHFHISPDGILLAYYKRADLHNYIKNEADVGLARKAEWILSLTTMVLHFHESQVLLADMHLGNVVIADDMSLKLIDFGKCRLLPLDVKIDQANDRGMTAQVDILHLGCLIYSIIAWKEFMYIYFNHDKKWPTASDLPSLRDVELGDIIEKCWTKGYSSMAQLHNDVQERLLTLSRTGDCGRTTG